MGMYVDLLRYSGGSSGLGGGGSLGGGGGVCSSGGVRGGGGAVRNRLLLGTDG